MNGRPLEVFSFPFNFLKAPGGLHGRTSPFLLPDLFSSVTRLAEWMKVGAPFLFLPPILIRFFCLRYVPPVSVGPPPSAREVAHLSRDV